MNGATYVVFFVAVTILNFLNEKFRFDSVVADLILMLVCFAGAAEFTLGVCLLYDLGPSMSPAVATILST